MEYYIGEIRLFPYPTLMPNGWHLCDGQALPVNQYQALYALLGNRYGGNTSSFNLPNLNGRTIIGMGPAPGRSVYTIGIAGGTEMVALTDPITLPPHNHLMNAATNYDQGGANTNFPGNSNVPVSATQPSKNAGTVNLYTNTVTPVVALAPVITADGAGAPHENRMPYLAMKYCICVTGGIYPQREN